MQEETSCNGGHRYFVAQDASYNGKVYVLLVCTSCGGAKKVEFDIAPQGTKVEVLEWQSR